MFHIADDIDDKSLKYYLKKQKTKDYSANLQSIISDLVILKSLDDQEYDFAREYCLEKLEDQINEDYHLFALYHLVAIAKKHLEDLSEAEYYLAEMKSRFPDEELTLCAQLIMGEDVDWTDPDLEGLEKSNSDETTEEIASEFSLNPAFPNPFNPSTTISFTLEKQSKIDIRIYNLTGSEVWNWGNNLDYGSGYHQITWNAIDASGSQLPTGIYFIKLISGKQIATQKVILMK